MHMKYIPAALLALTLTAGSAMAKDGPPRDHGKMLEEIDTDGDKAISKAESAAFHAKRFDEADTNGDGKLTPDEMKARHEKMRAKFKERRHNKKDD